MLRWRSSSSRRSHHRCRKIDSPTVLWWEWSQSLCQISLGLHRVVAQNRLILRKHPTWTLKLQLIERKKKIKGDNTDTYMEVVVSVEHTTSTTISSYKEKLLPPNPIDITKIISIILEQMWCYLEENNIALHEAFIPPTGPLSQT